MRSPVLPCCACVHYSAATPPAASFPFWEGASPPRSYHPRSHRIRTLARHAQPPGTCCHASVNSRPIEVIYICVARMRGARRAYRQIDRQRNARPKPRTTVRAVSSRRTPCWFGVEMMNTTNRPLKRFGNSPLTNPTFCTLNETHITSQLRPTSCDRTNIVSLGYTALQFATALF